MKDKGIVLSTKGDLAQVEVHCFTDSCQKCSAKSVCTGQKQAKGLLSVKNPLNALPGNTVEIDLPDTKYNKALIFLFGSLLLASLSGMGIGYLLSPFLPFSPSASSLLGFLFALFGTGVLLFRRFQKKDKHQLYPVIRDIISKGDYPG